MRDSLPIHWIQRILLLTAFLSWGFGLWAQPKEGTFNLGLISFIVTDSLMQENVFIESIKDQIKASSAYDVSYTPQSSMTVSRTAATTSRIIYNKESNVLITILETENEKWYSVDSFNQLLNSEMTHQMDSMMQSPSFQDSMKKLFHVSHNPEDEKLIFGIPCTKVTMMNPDSLDQIFSISYCTPLIPGAEVLGPLREIMPGVSLETTMFLEGFAITIGALAFTPGSFKNANFGINFKKYKKVNSEDLKEMAYHYRN